MLIFILGVLSSSIVDVQSYLDDQKVFENDLIKFKQQYENTIAYEVFRKFFLDLDNDVDKIYIDQEIMLERRTRIFYAMKIFDFFNFIFNVDCYLVPVIFDIIDTKKINLMNHLLLKIHHIICNMDKYANIFNEESCLKDFYSNRDFTEFFFDRSLVKYADATYESKLQTPIDYQTKPYHKMLYKVFCTEFNNVVNNYKKFKNEIVSKNFFIPILAFVDEAVYMISKNKILLDKKKMIKKSKTLYKSYLRNYSEKDLQNIKRLMCFMKHKLYLETELHIEHFFGLLRYFSINFNLNITIFLSNNQFYKTNCQIISIDGTNIENLMFFYEKVLNKTEFVEPLIKENIKNGQLHSFTTILDQETYSFDSKDGKDVGKYGCLVLSCNHFIGYKSLNEWFDNFMNKCPYCRSDAVPLIYFESQLYLVDD